MTNLKDFLYPRTSVQYYAGMDGFEINIQIRYWGTWVYFCKNNNHYYYNNEIDKNINQYIREKKINAR